MKVLLINGSPRGKGCTYTALSEIAGTLEKNGVQTEIFHIGTAAVSGCLACGRCAKSGRCVISDKVNEVLGRVADFDGFIFGSPVHYASAAGALLAFMDRLFHASLGVFKGKPAAAIVSCRRGGATASFDVLNKYFSISQMPIVTSLYWNMVHGQTPEQVKQDLEGMQTMRTLGENFAWLLNCIEAGKKTGVEFPKGED